jgi:5-methyltetrahydropteroyltriglutamate--homocysteine methyltransferase
VALFQPNRHYADDEAYLEALALALRHEYHAIVDAGLVLQLDSPDLGLGRHMMYKDLEEDAYLRRIELHVQALNHALAAIPADRIRMHVCWGNYEGPHHKDVPLAAILPVVLKAKPAGLLFETSNPRHAHEWETIAEMKHLIPADKVLIPGVLDSTTNFVEHPRLVAQRIARFADIVGADRVIAGTDCGFGTFAGFGAVDPSIRTSYTRSSRPWPRGQRWPADATGFRRTLRSAAAISPSAGCFRRSPAGRELAAAGEE